MTEAPKTLAGCLAAGEEEFTADLQIDAEVQETMKRDLQGMPGALLEMVPMATVLAALYRALDVDLTGILRSGWQTAVMLQEYRDPARHPPGEEKLVKIATTKLTSTHKPKLEVLVNGAVVGSLVFDAKLTLDIAGSRLRIRDGRIWEVMGSEFEGQCELSYRGLLLVRRRVGKFAIPGGLTFVQGIKIGPMPVLV
jgi:hypothetical protein